MFSQHADICEWYTHEHQDLLIYFDSWADLKHKVETTDYEAARERIAEFGRRHLEKTLNQWREVFNEIAEKLESEQEAG